MGMALGAAHYATAPREIGWVAVLLALAAFAMAGLAARGTRLAPAVALPLSMMLGLAAAKGEVARTDTGMMVGEATTRIVGRIENRTRDAKGRIRYLVAIEETRDPVLQHPPSRARLFVSAAHDPLPIGGTLEALVRLRQPSGPARPGGYDFAFHSYFDGIGAHGFVLGRPSLAAPPGDLRLSERLARLRAAVGDIARANVDGAAGAVAAALLVGDKRGIPEHVTEALRASGLAHVLAISGMHMALVTGLVLGGVRLGLAVHPSWSSRFSSKKIAALAALVVATAYLGLSGGAVSAQRAHAMLCVMLLAVLLDRPALTMRNVGIAAILVIALRPHEVTGPGFQMSFGATAALIAAYGWWRRRPRGTREEPLLPPALRAVAIGLATILFTSLVAGLATGMFAVHHFHRVAPLGLVANGLAMPLVSFVVMPMGIVSAFAMPFGLEAFPLAAMGWGIDWVIRIADWVATLRPPVVLGAIGTPSFVLLAIALFVLCAFRTRLALLGAPIAFAGVALAQAPADTLWIAERGDLVAVRDADGFAFARSRPNAFTADQWIDATALNALSPNANLAFECEPKDAICVAERHGLRIVAVRDRERWGEACDRGDIVVTTRRLNADRCRSGAWLLNAKRTNELGALTIDLAAVARLGERAKGHVSDPVRAARLRGELRHAAPPRSLLADVPTSELELHATNALLPAPRPWTAHRRAVIVRTPLRGSLASDSGG